MNQPLENLPATAQTMAMKGGGYYSQRTQGAKDVIDNAVYDKNVAHHTRAVITDEQSSIADEQGV